MVLEQLAEKLYSGRQPGTMKEKWPKCRRDAVPVFKNILLNQGSHIENVVVPFSDGKKSN